MRREAQLCEEKHSYAAEAALPEDSVGEELSVDAGIVN
jgi:hypothetical protein